MSSWTQCMRKHRERKGLTQRQLAEKAGIPLACILYYEHGKGEPGLFNLVCMADAIGIGLDEYIGREVKANPKIDK